MADEDSDPLHPVSIKKTNDAPTTALDVEPASDPFGVQAAIAEANAGNNPKPTDPNIKGQADRDDDGDPAGPGA